MSVETQEPLTSQSFNQSQNKGQLFNQSDFFLHKQPENSFHSSPKPLNFYGSYKITNDCFNGNNNGINIKEEQFSDNYSKSQNSDVIIEKPQSLNKPQSPQYNTVSAILKESEPSKVTEEKYMRNIKESHSSAHSPLSNDSLSDSEVPNSETNNINQSSSLDDSGLKGFDNKKETVQRSSEQNNYYEDYLKHYADNFFKNDKEGSELTESKSETSSEDQIPKKKRDPVEIAKLEEAVKKNLDEAIRQHHSRLTCPPDTTSYGPHTAIPDDSLRQPETNQNTRPLSPHSVHNRSPLSGSPNSRHNQHSPHSLSPHARPVSPHRHGVTLSNAFIQTPVISPNKSPIVGQRSPVSLAFHATHLPHPISSNTATITSKEFPLFSSESRSIVPPVFPPPLHSASSTLVPPMFNDFMPRTRPPGLTMPEFKSRVRSDSISDHPLGLTPAAAAKRITDGKEYYYCHLCSFVGNTENEFNVHMNTHFEHQCPHCDYKSRTEGRLKRHIKDFHTEDNPDDFTGGRMLRNNSNKPKIFRCRQCEYATSDKEEYWKHARSHIKDDKCLHCPKCPFVTEYKHHLEYHLRNHFGSKPFKCHKCNYSCVNKSMLNSHMKSHTNVYQYRCQDCTYATKYCHSLKLHLSKYNHQPATVLNNDGSLPVDGSGDFDLVSKRGPPRGPRLLKPSPEGMSPGLDHIDPNLLVMHSNFAAMASHHRHNPLGGMAAMMGAFWGSGANGHPPPQMLPVRGLQPLSVQVPSSSGISDRMMDRKMDKYSPSCPDSSGFNNAESNSKCKFCEFSTANPHHMAEHVMKTHSNEHRELFKLLGFKPEFFPGSNEELRNKLDRDVHARARDGQEPSGIREDQRRREDIEYAQYVKNFDDVSDDESNLPESKGYVDDGSNSYSPGSQDDYSNNMGDDSMNEYSKNMARTLADEIEKEALKKQSKDLALDMTSGKHSNCSDNECDDDSANLNRKRKSDDPVGVDPPKSNVSMGSDENDEVINNSPNHRKRSRKGKAYKLDMISIKLQEQQYQDQLDEEERKDMEDEMGNTSADEYDMDKDPSVAGYHGERADDTNDNTKFKPNIQPSELINGGLSAGGSPVAELSRPKDTVDSVSLFSGSMNRKKLFIAREMEKQAREKVTTEMDVDKVQSQSSGDNSTDGNNWSKYECIHCGIAFKDCIMYTMHMGYHGFQNPFTCNRCGQTTKDKVEFFLHIARKPHA